MRSDQARCRFAVGLFPIRIDELIAAYCDVAQCSVSVFPDPQDSLRICRLGVEDMKGVVRDLQAFMGVTDTGF